MENKKDDYPLTNALAWALGSVAVAGMVVVSIVTNAIFRRKKK
ncbi:MAG TPA: hypothetical protein PK543_00330 [Candidatus Saccharibacteria bacterium]|nr:hypothetical protein [Candidatus Saccharibacteria bacterium]